MHEEDKHMFCDYCVPTFHLKTLEKNNIELYFALTLTLEFYAVIANGLCRQLWHRMFPEVSNIDNIFEVKNMTEGVEFEPDDSTGGAHLERDHRVFAFLTRGLTSYMRNDCISDAICASSTDHYPRESIKNTLEPSDVVDDRPSYWSSKGSIDVAFPETLIYRLAARLCVISEIHVKPFQGLSRSSLYSYFGTIDITSSMFTDSKNALAWHQHIFS